MRAAMLKGFAIFLGLASLTATILVGCGSPTQPSSGIPGPVYPPVTNEVGSIPVVSTAQDSDSKPKP